MQCARFSLIFYFMFKTKPKSGAASGSSQTCSLTLLFGLFSPDER